MKLLKQEIVDIRQILNQVMYVEISDDGLDEEMIKNKACLVHLKNLDNDKIEQFVVPFNSGDAMKCFVKSLIVNDSIVTNCVLVRCGNYWGMIVMNGYEYEIYNIAVTTCNIEVETSLNKKAPL